jgi:hypothetical protein
MYQFRFMFTFKPNDIQLKPRELRFRENYLCPYDRRKAARVRISDKSVARSETF